MDIKEKVIENALRRQAKRLGLILMKSRARRWSIENHQAYRIIDRNLIIRAGEKYNLTQDDVAIFLYEEEENARRAG